MSAKVKNFISYSILILGSLISTFFVVSLLSRPHLEVSAALTTTSTTLCEISSPLTGESILSNMSLREKVGQLIMVNYRGEEEDVAEWISDYPVGGIMLNAFNINGRNGKKLLSAVTVLQSAGCIPLLISVDQEGGEVQRLSSILESYPSPFELFQNEGAEGVSNQALYFSTELPEIGINVNFAPVLDVPENDGSILSGRSFSEDLDENAALCQSVIDIYSKSETIACVKHFPGYGATTIDPHDEICEDNTSVLTEIAEPFLNLTNMEMIMTAHVIYDGYELPATLSEEILSLLRKEGFEGILITDDLQMGAITQSYDFDEAAVLALSAGCDITLSITKTDNWKNNAVKLFYTIEKAVENGEISEEEINEKVLRILNLKLSRFSEDFQF